MCFAYRQKFDRVESSRCIVLSLSLSLSLSSFTHAHIIMQIGEHPCRSFYINRKIERMRRRLLVSGSWPFSRFSVIVLFPIPISTYVVYYKCALCDSVFRFGESRISLIFPPILRPFSNGVKSTDNAYCSTIEAAWFCFALRFVLYLFETCIEVKMFSRIITS